MKHPVELALVQYMEDAASGKSSISDTTIERIAKEVSEAVQRQFGGKSDRKTFGLRMSNIGRPSCQLWWYKNAPDKATPPPYNFVMNMLLGDIVETVFKALLTEAGVEYQDNARVELELGDTKISGTYDIVIDGKVDDIKSASNWSYKNKFESFETLNQGDSFGYVGQLVGYAEASGYDVGGWWVVSKASGEFKYVPADGVNTMEVMHKLKRTAKSIHNNELVREYEPEPETFNGKSTGNIVLNKSCSFCSFKKSCWPSLVTLPSVFSKAKNPKMVDYVKVVKTIDT